MSVKEHLQFVKDIITKTEFNQSDCDVFEKWLQKIANELASKKLSPDDFQVIRNAFGDAFSENTTQGLVLLKLHGYAGDFEVIDRMYQQHISENQKFRKWDIYLNGIPSTIAVRNRKTYFIELLQSVEEKRIEQNAQKFNVLNIASGSGRDMQEFFIQTPNKLFFDCIDQDADAIDFAKNLCADYLSQIEFHQANALRFRTDKKYNLIWSAGLFDYFNDKTFKFMLKRYFSMLEDGGEMVIGNFSENNPSRNYMEVLGDWYLNHRSEEKLIELAQECDLSASSITVGQEPLGVNLFLHIKK